MTMSPRSALGVPPLKDAAQGHQIELEMSNEALVNAQVALEESRDSEGRITQINRAGTALRFTAFVAATDHVRWAQCLGRSIGALGPTSTELRLLRADGRAGSAAGHHCRCRIAPDVHFQHCAGPGQDRGGQAGHRANRLFSGSRAQGCLRHGGAASACQRADPGL